MNNHYYTWENFTNDVKIISGQIMQGSVPKKIIGIKRGGVYLATTLSYITNIPVDYCSPEQVIKEENVLIADDICDSGETFYKITKNIKNYKTASLYFNIKQSFKVNYFARKLDRDYDKFWIVFPWEMNT